jgi:hypothetical protein
MREFLSQTNDVSNYCYLTDGGHFDNTGLYSLVQRGCRYIVIADCGADPGTSFGDLGDAIRRCRIDFGTEIDLNIEDFVKYEKEEVERPVKRHFVAGSIKYSEDHLRRLRGLGDDADLNEDYLEGVIVLIKPSLTPGDRADVRQYALENEDFPQTTTANQFFDEAQFESYRRLGELCSKNVFEFARPAASSGLQRTLDTLKASSTDRESVGRLIRCRDVETLFRKILTPRSLPVQSMRQRTFRRQFKS